MSSNNALSDNSMFGFDWSDLPLMVDVVIVVKMVVIVTEQKVEFYHCLVIIPA